MDGAALRWLIVGAFGMHGLGMLGAAGYLPFDAKRSFIGESWLFGGEGLSSIAGVVVWGIAGLGYLAAAIGFWRDTPWWQAAAWVGAAFTIAAIALWIGKVPGGVYVGGLLAVATVAYLIMR